MKKVKQGARSYIVKVLNGMAMGLFSSLIIGLILKQIGVLTEIKILSQIGQLAQYSMGAAIGGGVAFSIGASPLGIFSGVVAGAIGSGSLQIENSTAILSSIGEPIGALISSMLGVEVSKRVEGKSKLDIILIPAVTIIIGGISGHYLAPIISNIMNGIGSVVNFSTNQHPIIMGILVSAIMGIALTMPISSAAIGISLGLDGLAAGAAIIGCCCHMIGFAVASYKENGFGGFIAQGLGTSMIQIPNIVRKPKIMLPSIISSIILGPIGTTIFNMRGEKIGSGMGSSGLVGQLSTIETMGIQSIYKIVLLHFILPGLISYLVYIYMINRKIIFSNDFRLEKIN